MKGGENGIGPIRLGANFMSFENGLFLPRILPSEKPSMTLIGASIKVRASRAKS